MRCRLRWIPPLLVAAVLVASASAHEEHGHHHEPHHWESAEMRHELMTQTGAIAAAGVIAGGYWLFRRRMSA
ncbi:MAG: hypothetical protein HPY54_02225 [Chthonomonadetes bacterium]|nr:hypothetical protein [Chthonomonadetes bacterium]